MNFVTGGLPWPTGRVIADSGEQGETFKRSILVILSNAYRWALRRLHHHHDAEDVSQEVALDFTLQQRKNPKYGDGSQPLATLIYAMTEGKMIDRKRRETSADRRAEGYVEHRLACLEDWMNPDSETLLAELNDVVVRAWRNLPDGPREAFRLVRELLLTYKEAAQLTGVEPTTIRQHLVLALKVFRDELVRCGIITTEEAKSLKRGGGRLRARSSPKRSKANGGTEQ